MPEISQLPDGAALTGAETLPLVQAGITVKAELHALLAAPRPAAVANARWVACPTPDGPPLNRATLTLQWGDDRDAN